MGFSLEGCKKAAFHTKNAGVEAAMNWVLEHSGDPDFGFPFVNPRYIKYSILVRHSYFDACSDFEVLPI